MKKSLFLMALAAGSTAFANVSLPGIFSDHAVLQKSNATAVFGKADPGEKVSVNYAGVSASTVAGKDGKWLVRLDLSKTGDAGADMVIKGKNTVTIKDVITGEVWFCIGQSNMAMMVKDSMNAKENIAKSANDRIRHFRTHSVSPEKPVDDIRGRWVKADPQTTGTFSATGYFFARKVNKECGVAVGLINPSWGGSSIESWISKEKILKGSTPAVAKNAQKELDEYFNYDSNLEKYIKAVKAWTDKVGYNDDAEVVLPAADAKWSKVQNMQRSVDGNGIIWFRKSVEITKRDYQWNKVRIEIGRPQVPVDVYLDGKKVASRDMKTAACGRQYTAWINKKDIAPGKHEIMLRAYAYTKRVSFPRYHYIGTQKNTFNGWEMYRQKSFAKLTKEQANAMPKYIGTKPYGSKTPTMIWNGLVHPIIPYTMRGALWYQGEQNAGAQAYLYGDQVRALVSDLRERFENPDLRFYAVQLPNFKAKSDDPNKISGWVRVRAGQNSAMNIPGVAQAIIIDNGEANDIHPMDKEPVGERLAAIALRNDYGKDIPCYSPEAVKAVVSGNSVKVDFKYTDGGLTVKALPDYYWLVYRSGKKSALVRNSPKAQVEGFALCGKDGKWCWADKAEIAGNSVVVSSAKVPAPVAVRYAWQDNPTCNLYNGAGFPAAPFELKTK